MIGSTQLDTFNGSSAGTTYTSPRPSSQAINIKYIFRSSGFEAVFSETTSVSQTR